VREKLQKSAYKSGLNQRKNFVYLSDIPCKSNLKEDVISLISPPQARGCVVNENGWPSLMHTRHKNEGDVNESTCGNGETEGDAAPT
jgi:hypothetical protein